MMTMCIKQRLSNIWTSIHKKLSNTEAELEKKASLIKKRVYSYQMILSFKTSVTYKKINFSPNN